jgi:hypothetical protein
MVYLRVVALVLLAMGLFRAGQILGITLDGKDFADLTPAWRAGATTLILVDLFAAVGLWVGAAWGPVMWAVAIAVEVSMHTLFADLFGVDIVRVAFDGLLFSGFVALAVVDWRRTMSE